MTGDDAQLQRLRFLARVVRRESKHLLTTDRRVFAKPFTQDRAQALADDVELAERVAAFAARFGRLQDTLGDKLIPALLRALGEPVGAAIDNLDRAERLGWLPSSEQWLIVRRLRNQMVHEYVEDAVVLFAALQAGHRFVPQLTFSAQAMTDEMAQRGWQ